MEPTGFDRLLDIVRRLRAPDGCPWDLAQDPGTLRGNLIEEAYEAISAIEESDDENLREELGDLLLVATMIAYMKEQEGRFRVAEVLEHICAKLVRRHPHVFGGPRKDTPGEVLEQWNHIKENVEGKKTKHSALERVPRTLPPLERAYEIQQKVAKVGFDWAEAGPVWEKMQEELAELREAHERQDPLRVEAELGDLLFTAVNLGRLLGVDPTLALNGTNQKFIARFQELEARLQSLGLKPQEAGLERMDAIWNQIKAQDGRSSSK
jgi:tetrapyrrole methylase family protein/MazG family protein